MTEAAATAASLPEEMWAAGRSKRDTHTLLLGQPDGSAETGHVAGL